jgi:hypothetical protein
MGDYTALSAEGIALFGEIEATFLLAGKKPEDFSFAANVARLQLEKRQRPICGCSADSVWCGGFKCIPALGYALLLKNQVFRRTKESVEKEMLYGYGLRLLSLMICFELLATIYNLI